MWSNMKPLTVILASLLTVHAGAQSVQLAAPGMPCAAPADAAPPRGTLYRIHHQGNTAYLFGTIHVGLPGFYPLEPCVTAALAQATRLAIEVDIRDNESFQHALNKFGFYPDQQTIGAHLSAGSFSRLQQTLARLHIPVEQVHHMRPWLVANMLLAQALEHDGYSRGDGTEYYLLAAASAQSTPVEALESAEYQLSLFDTLNAQQQEQYLLENLAELDDGNAVKKARALIEAWSTADGKQLDALLRASMQEPTISSAFIHRTLLEQRNPHMAGKIEGFLQTGQITFVGVGLMHLLGDSGIPSLLRQRGYQVDQLY